MDSSLRRQLSADSLRSRRLSDYAGTRSFFQKLIEKNTESLRDIYGCALHYCGGADHDDSIDFSPDGWYSLLADANRMEELIRNHWQIIGQFDTQHRVKLIVDEWGAGTKLIQTSIPGISLHISRLCAMRSFQVSHSISLIGMQTRWQWQTPRS